MDDRGALWIFGYGSLVWRPDFPHVERRPGRVRGFARRFWQGSTDHRGVPGAPGRVATVVEQGGAVCTGVAFRVAREHEGPVLAGLDHRERGGFERRRVEVALDGGGAPARVVALMYWATASNANYLGPAPLAEIAEQIRSAHGPSGSNLDYLLRLRDALRGLPPPDEHVEALAELAGRP